MWHTKSLPPIHAGILSGMILHRPASFIPPPVTSCLQGPCHLQKVLQTSTTSNFYNLSLYSWISSGPLSYWWRWCDANVPLRSPSIMWHPILCMSISSGSLCYCLLIKKKFLWWRIRNALTWKEKIKLRVLSILVSIKVLGSPIGSMTHSTMNLWPSCKDQDWVLF